jgi:hypothetical protein
LAASEPLFVGIDLHKRTWHITIRTTDYEVFSGSIAGSWDVLKKLLDHYKESRINAVYEPGYFAYSLFDKLTAIGIILLFCYFPSAPSPQMAELITKP